MIPAFTLVDSSAWIEFFRGTVKAVSRIDPLLAGGMAATTGPIWAEVTSGAKNNGDFVLLSNRLRSLLWVEVPKDVWELVASSRFLLARRGIQASIVDLVIAHSAIASGCRLLTFDKDFLKIAEALPLEIDLLKP